MKSQKSSLSNETVSIFIIAIIVTGKVEDDDG